MIFLSRRGNQRIVLRPATIEHLKVAGQDGLKAVPIKGITVEFQELKGQGGRGGMFPTLGSNKRGFRGMFDTADYKKVSRDIEEHELVQLMLGARSYGSEFISMKQDGTGMVSADDQFVPLTMRDGKQQWFCVLNGRTFKSTPAMKNHIKSATFQATLKELNREAQVELETI